MMRLSIERLSHRYGGHWALQDVSLEWTTGIVGLIGPNGAGKTTLMRIVAGLLPPSQGSILLDGRDTREDPAGLRDVLGYLPQDFGSMPEFTPRQFLACMAAMKGLPSQAAARRADECLTTLGLDEGADRRLATLSGGMKQLRRKHRASHVGHTNNGTALRLLSSTRPTGPAVSVEATLEEAYLLRTSD